MRKIDELVALMKKGKVAFESFIKKLTPKEERTALDSRDDPEKRRHYPGDEMIRRDIKKGVAEQNKHPDSEARGHSVSSTELMSRLDDALSANKGEKYGGEQSWRAKQRSWEVEADDGTKTTVKEIIYGLATRKEFEDSTAGELWPQFYFKLEEMGLHPKENPPHVDQDKCTISYNFKENRKSITFGRFATIVSESRRKS